MKITSNESESQNIFLEEFLKNTKACSEMNVEKPISSHSKEKSPIKPPQKKTEKKETHTQAAE